MKKGPMISCEEATQLVVMKNGESLKFYDRMRLKVHLMMCKYCSRFEEQNRIIEEQIKKLNTVSVTEMPDDAKLRIESKIDKINYPK